MSTWRRRKHKNPDRRQSQQTAEALQCPCARLFATRCPTSVLFLTSSAKPRIPGKHMSYIDAAPAGRAGILASSRHAYNSISSTCSLGYACRSYMSSCAGGNCRQTAMEDARECYRMLLCCFTFAYDLPRANCAAVQTCLQPLVSGER